MSEWRQKIVKRVRRQTHVRKHVRGSTDRPRLTVYRSGKHISAQVIDDDTGRTLASASTQQKEVVAQVTKTGNKDAAKAVGKTLAERAKQAGVAKVKFDRGHYKYHGRIAALADAAREAGLDF